MLPVHLSGTRVMYSNCLVPSLKRLVAISAPLPFYRYTQVSGGYGKPNHPAGGAISTHEPDNSVRSYATAFVGRLLSM